MDYTLLIPAIIIVALVFLLLIIGIKSSSRIYLLGVSEVGTMMIRPKAIKNVILHVAGQFHEIIKVKSKITHTRQGLKLNVTISLNQVVDEDFIRELQTEIHNVLQNMGVEVYSINVSISSINPQKIR